MTEKNQPAYPRGNNSVQSKIPRGVLKVMVMFQRRRDRALIWICLLSVMAHLTIVTLFHTGGSHIPTFDLTSDKNTRNIVRLIFVESYRKGSQAAVRSILSDSTIVDYFKRDSIEFESRLK